MSGELVAVKTFKVKSENDKLKQSFEAELKAGSSGLEHDNVLSILEGGLLPVMENGKQTSKPIYYLVSKVAENKEAFEFVEAAEGLNGGKEPIARMLIYQLLSAVDYIHGKGLTHRDIKLENCFLDKDCVLKLADFGLAKMCTGNEVLKTNIGTPQYMAPEIGY